MNHSDIQHFVNSFIIKNRRERLLYELTTIKKRSAGVSRFCHQAREILDPSKIIMEGKDIDRTTEFKNFVTQHDEICLVLSPDFYMDERYLSFEDAVHQANSCLDAVIIMGSSFAVVYAEPMKDGRGKFLLSE